MNRDKIKSVIESTITEIEAEYQKTQGLILTEDDLKSILFHKLSNNYPRIIKPRITEDDHVSASMLHTELSWYDKRGKLTIKPDITILDSRYLSILHKNGDKVSLPSKGYSFRGDAVLMELKFIRNKTGIRPTTVTGRLRKDLVKIKNLFQRLENQGAPYHIFCYFIIFNKTDIKCKEFLDFKKSINTSDNIKYKLIYATGKVKFPNKTSA